MSNITITERKDIKNKDRRFSYSFYYNGKRYRKSGYRTKTLAREHARKHLEELEEGLSVSKDITFKKYYLDWLSIYKDGQISKGQYYWYERSLDLFIEYFSEDKLLKTITKNEYQLFLNWYGEGRTKSSLNKLHVCISQVLREAHNEGILKLDPSYRPKLKATKEAQKTDEKFLSTKQYLNMIEYLRNRKERSYLLLFILAITGARFSEINKLELDDFINDDTIHLRGTKTTSSDRMVEISKRDMKHIKKRLEELPAKKNGKLFDLSHRASMKSFQYAMKELNIDLERTPYSLRHTHCSYLISKSIPIEYISKRLGHSSIRMTLDVYSHLLDEHREEQANKVRNLFS